jgi:hypothetical protein
MARKRVKSGNRRGSLPKPGDAFLVPLADGRFGLCRVLRRLPPEGQEKKGDLRKVLVAGSPWIGDEPPDLDDPRLREILEIKYQGVESRQLYWVASPPPDSFRRLGTIEPSEEESTARGGMSGWLVFASDLLAQWRWDNDREALLREQKKVLERWKAHQEGAAQRHREYLESLTFESLRKKRRFVDWKSMGRPDAAIVACRKVFRETIDRLLELGPGPSEGAAIDILRGCIEQLNELDERYDGFIETGEREELCKEFDEIVHMAGLRDHGNLADNWRDW